MTEITKFRFDRRFDTDPDEVERKAAEAAAAEEAPPPPPTFSEGELEAAKAAAYEDGRRAGSAEAEKASERRAAMALGVIGERLAEIERTFAASRSVSVAETARLAHAIADKVAGAALAAAPTTEIEALARECLERLFGEARVVVHVTEGLEQTIEPRLEQIAVRSGFAGALVVRGDPDIAEGDCRIDWTHGGAARERAVLWEEIEALIARFVDGAPGEAPATEAAAALA